MKVLIPAVFVIITIICFKVYGFIKNKYWKESIVFLVLMSIAYIYSYRAFMDVKIPDISSFLKIIFDPVARYFYGPFKH